MKVNIGMENLLILVAGTVANKGISDQQHPFFRKVSLLLLFRQTILKKDLVPKYNQSVLKIDKELALFVIKMTLIFIN